MTNASPPSRAGLHPELREHLDQLEAVRSRAHLLLDDLDEEQARWQPAPERWSIAECIEHLNRVASKVLPRIDRAMRRGRRERLLAPLEPAEFRHGFLGNKIVRAMEPPPKVRLTAPRLYRPQRFRARHRPAAKIFARFFTLQDELEARLVEAQGLDLARIRLASPVTRLLKLSLGQWFAFVLTHERRHLWQASQLLEDPHFPGRRVPEPALAQTPPPRAGESR